MSPTPFGTTAGLQLRGWLQELSTDPIQTGSTAAASAAWRGVGVLVPTPVSDAVACIRLAMLAVV